MTLTRIALLAVLASFAGCASAGPLKPDAIFRHPTTGDVQWCDKGDKGGVGVAAKVLFGAIVTAAQGAVYTDCKTNWATKGHARLDSTAKLSLEDQQRYETDLERMAKERADSIRPR